MPHQCLKCGKVFPSGSPEILKGCSDCGGKKFFYTEQPVSDDERERLIEQANKDIKVLIHEILSQSQREKFDFYDEDGNAVPKISPEGKSDWVKVSPRSDKKDEKSVRQVDEGVSAEAKVDAEHKLPTVKEILQELRQSIPENEIKGAGRLKKDVESKEPGKKKRLKRLKGKGKQSVKPKKKKHEIKPEIITVKEPGVYNIKLDKLMKGFPIIIYRDGSYLVHLPSVFESIERRRRK
jgi:predicted  nucleic acid-binding Zn-ribbon protein